MPMIVETQVSDRIFTMTVEDMERIGYWTHVNRDGRNTWITRLAEDFFTSERQVLQRYGVPYEIEQDYDVTQRTFIASLRWIAVVHRDAVQVPSPGTIALTPDMKPGKPEAAPGRKVRIDD